MKNKKKLLLVNQSIGEFFNDIILNLPLNNQISIFSGKYNYKLNKNISFHKSIEYDNKSIKTRFLTWIIFTLDLCKLIVFQKDHYNNILFVSNPPIAPIIGLFSKTSYSILIYDLYPEIIKKKYIKLSSIFPINIILKIWSKLNYITYKKANYIFTLTPEMRSTVNKYFPDNFANKEKIKVINPWFSSKINPKIVNKSNSFKKAFKEEERLLITYSGNIGISHPIEFIILALPILKKSAKFVIISKGEIFKRLQKISKNLKLNSNDISFINPLKEKEYFESLASTDLSIVALDKFASTESIPSKTFNSLYLGKPIIALSYKTSSLSNLLNKYDCGFNIEPKKENISLLEKKLYYLNNNKNALKKLSDNCKKASKDFNPKNVHKLISLWLSD